MSRTFFPKAHYMPYGNGYLALYRWYVESNWTQVPGKIPHPTAAGAIAAAEQYMTARMNTANHHEVVETNVADPALSGEAAAFIARRDQEAEEQKARVFASMSTVFLKGGRTVAVERRRRA